MWAYIIATPTTVIVAYLVLLILEFIAWRNSHFKLTSSDMQ